MFSNAALLTPEYANDLVEAEVDEVSVSCHGITPNEVRATMGLRKYDAMIANVSHLSRRVKGTRTRMYVTYNGLDELESSDEAIHSFWEEKGIDCQGPNPVWNRAGQLTKLPTKRRAYLGTSLTDFTHASWCARLSYFDSIAANGDYVYCGCGFFAADAPAVGNVQTDDLSSVHAGYEDVLRRKAENEMCRNCVKPSERYIVSEIVDTLEGEMNVRF